MVDKCVIDAFLAGGEGVLVPQNYDLVRSLDTRGSNSQIFSDLFRSVLAFVETTDAV